MQLARVGNRAVLMLVAAVMGAGALQVNGLGSALARAERLTGRPGPDPGAPVPPTSGEFFARPAPPAPTIELVAMVGDPAPGLPAGFVYDYLSVPQIDGAGNVLFMAYVDGPGVSGANNLADFYGPPGAVSKLVWESEPAFGIPGAVVCYIASENVAENGLIALTLEVTGYGVTPDYNDRVLYVGTPGEFVKVVQSADQAIDCPAGVYYDASYNDFSGNLSDNGTLRFSGAVAGEGVTEWNDRCVWIGPPDDLHLVYRDDMQAAQCPEGVLYRSADLFSFNDLGEVAFRAVLRGTGVTSANDGGHFMGGPGTLTKISREGDPAEPFGPGVTWKAVSLAPNSMNAWGDVNENAMIQGTGVTTANDQVSLVATPEGLCVLGREGDPVLQLGADVHISALGNCLLNNQREAFYKVGYAGPGITEANKWAMYFRPYDGASQVMRDSDPAPTFPPDVVVSHIYNATALVAMNDAGDIVFPTEIGGPGITDADKVVLWFRHHVLKRWVPLLRSGDEVAGRTVYAVDETDFGDAYCGATGGADGMWQSFNDAGMLAIRLEFTDGTHGIFRILPPAFGDADGDGRVGAGDLRLMERAWTGPGDGAGAERTVFDLDADGDIDLADQALLQQLLE
jgi:hypothetical protein